MDTVPRRMDAVPTFTGSTLQVWSDEQLIDAVLAGTPALYEILVRRYNQKVYRIVRSVLPDDAEAEDVMQEAYLRAYKNLQSFERRSSFSTWLARIAVNEALARVKTGRRFETVDFTNPQEPSSPLSALSTPEEEASLHETRTLIEQGILALPQKYRTILMMRDVEEMSTIETAEALGMSETVVKVRLHRARALLRKELYARAGATSTMAFQFLAPRCDRVTNRVMNCILAM